MAALEDIKAEQGDEITIDLPQAEETESKQRYKSYRKKYRKMKITFDESMEDANQLFIAENTAWEIAKRIQEQNDQLMEIILDVNASLNTPAHLRYDISSPPLAPVPDLEVDRPEVAGKKPTHSLTALRKTTHTALDIYDLNEYAPELIDIDNTLPPGYLTSQHEEEYITALDASLANAAPGGEVSLSGTHLFPQPKDRTIPTERDFAVHYPGSVYNWLRLHQPQVFDTKDKESERGDAAPLKGKGKKEKTMKQEFEGADEEDVDPMLGAGLGSAKGAKRKREDDVSYRPKGGHSGKPSKRKRDKEDADGKTGTKKPKKSGIILVEEEP